MRTGPFAVCAIVAAVLMACGGAAAPAAPARPGTLVNFTRSGGFAGVQLHLVVTRDGHTTTTSGTRGRQRHRLRPRTLTHLRRLLAAARWDRLPKLQAGCLDCFVYTVRYRGDRVAFNLGRAVPASVKAAVDELVRIAGGAR
jgi:hypothetical protein